MTTTDPGKSQARRPWLAVITGVAIAGGILATIVVPRIERDRAARAESARKPRVVETVIVQAAPSTINLVLVGTAVPIAMASLRAPAAGVVDSVGANIGEHVTRGQLLARLTLAEPLVGPPVEPGTPANEIVAPFDGIVTHRATEVGMRVSPSGVTLFEIADTSTLKVYVDVPQTMAPWVRVGESVAVTARAVTLATMTGAVVRTSGALDPSTHTMRIEVQVPGERLLAGSAVTVRFAVTREMTPPMIPANALVFGMTWPRVVRLVDGRAHFAPIELGWDRGREVEIASGVEVGDVIVVSPPDNVREGEPLHIDEATAAR